MENSTKTHQTPSDNVPDTFMTNKNNSIFAPGYNRLQTTILDRSYESTRIDPRELSVTPKQTEPLPNATEPPVHTLQTDQSHSQDLQPAPITEVFDPKNQLTSLIKNAKLNEQAITARNERIRRSKHESRTRYGW
ncbi:hypothetical protein HG537_0H04260 [Torulaspora globosa]|uniref:Uncharacterized protein n=1 Tax=Torulaspora globosa TaxID=48254 RepID=A0A7H9HZJ5_9SACH|nr:hypothetical protein HG537_0H04260 [Torulaspora sp. CBS 2947]